MKLFVVIGLGQFGRHTALTLYKGGGDVLAIDSDEKRVEWIKDDVGQAVCMDATDVDVMRTLGLENADTAILALGEEDLEASILACTVLGDLGVGRIIVRAASEIQGRILTRVGATRIIYPEKQMGEQLGKSILASGVLDQVVLSTGQAVAHIHPKNEFIGKNLKEARLYERFGVMVIGIEHPHRHVDDKGELHEELRLNSVPRLDTIILEEDVLVVVGEQAKIEAISASE